MVAALASRLGEASRTTRFMAFIAAAAMSAGVASADAPDPVGDTLPGDNGFTKYDLIATDAVYSATQITLNARFNNQVIPSDKADPNSIFGGWELDTDQNPATGFPANAEVVGRGGPWTFGGDYSVSFYGGKFGDPQGVASVYRRDSLSKYTRIGTAPLVYGPDSLQATVPLSLLGSDDGLMNYVTFWGPVGGLGHGYTDLSPEGPAPSTSVPVPEPGAVGSAILLAIVLGRRPARRLLRSAPRQK